MLARFAKREHRGEVGTVRPFALAVVETAFGAMAAVELLGMVVGKAEKRIGFFLLMGQDMEIGVPRDDRLQSVLEEFSGSPVNSAMRVSLLRTSVSRFVHFFELGGIAKQLNAFVGYRGNMLHRFIDPAMDEPIGEESLRGGGEVGVGRHLRLALHLPIVAGRNLGISSVSACGST